MVAFLAWPADSRFSPLARRRSCSERRLPLSCNNPSRQCEYPCGRRVDTRVCNSGGSEGIPKQSLCADFYDGWASRRNRRLYKRLLHLGQCRRRSLEKERACERICADGSVTGDG